MAQQAEQMAITINYGCNATHVLMQFSAPVKINQMTIEQAEAMRAALAEAIQALKDVKSGKRVLSGTMPGHTS